MDWIIRIAITHAIAGKPSANNRGAPTADPILDDFDRALIELAKSADEQTLKGVELIYTKLVSTLKSKGLEKIEVAPNDVFDSEHHDAVTQIPAPTPDAKGKIVDVVQTGYKLSDKVIRFPKVVVAQ